MTILAGHLTYGLIALSYLLRDIYWLRWVALVASLLSIVFNYFAPADPLWIPIGWNVLFVAINLYHVQDLMRRTRSNGLSAEEIELARSFFAGATSRQLSTLFSKGRWRQWSPGDVLANQGQQSGQVAVLYDGEVQVMLDGRCHGRIEDRTFVGEISFLTREPASATVVVTKPSRTLQWRAADLRSLLEEDESLAAQFQNWLAVDLVRKLNRQEDELEPALV